MLADGWMRGQHKDGGRRGTLETMWRKILQKSEIMKRTQADKRKSQRIGRWKRCWMDGEREKRKTARKREKRESKRERSSSVHAPLPTQRGLLPGGDSDFKPLPCFIFPWQLQPDQSRRLPGGTQPGSVQRGPQSPPHRLEF